MKKKRHALILELVREFEITTQDELLIKLRERGFETTQATISRDIKELHLVKALGSNGQYHYTLDKRGTRDSLSKFRSILIESVIAIDCAGNMSVIRCYSGMAMAACAAIDAMEWDGVVGTLAGDDTIFVLCRSDRDALAMKTDVNKMLAGR